VRDGADPAGRVGSIELLGARKSGLGARRPSTAGVEAAPWGSPGTCASSQQGERRRASGPRCLRSDGLTSCAGGAQRPRDEPPGQPGLVSRRNRHPAGRVGSIELLGGGASYSRERGGHAAEGNESAPQEAALRLRPLSSLQFVDLRDVATARSFRVCAPSPSMQTSVEPRRPEQPWLEPGSSAESGWPSRHTA